MVNEKGNRGTGSVSLDRYSEKKSAADKTKSKFYKNFKHTLDQRSEHYKTKQTSWGMEIDFHDISMGVALIDTGKGVFDVCFEVNGELSTPTDSVKLSGDVIVRSETNEVFQFVEYYNKYFLPCLETLVEIV